MITALLAVLILISTVNAINADRVYFYYSYENETFNQTLLTQVNDTTGNGHHATKSGNFYPYHSGIIGNGHGTQNFSTNYFTIQGFDFDETQDFSFSSWVKPFYNATYQSIADAGTFTDWIALTYNNPPWVAADMDFNVSVFCRDGNGANCNGFGVTGGNVVSPLAKVTMDVYTLVTYAYNSTNDTIMLCSNNNCSYHDYIFGNVGVMSSLYLWNGHQGNPDFYGDFDETFWYNGTLTQSDVIYLYNDGNGCQYPFINCTNCTVNWTCTDYGACNSSDVRPCNSTVDNNTCGLPYTGDFSEFTPLACDFCTPNWSCVGYGACNISALKPCNLANDSNNCSEAYAGNYSEFPAQSCTFIPSFDVTVEAVDNTQEIMLAILSGVFLVLFIVGVWLQLNILVFFSGLGFLFVAFDFVDIASFKILFAAIGIVFILLWALRGFSRRDDTG